MIALALLCLLPSSLSPSVPREESAVLRAALAASVEPVRGWRRHLHANPELGEREHDTASFVAALLEEWGLEVRRGIGGTGVVGLLRGEQPGPLRAWRADMDALPVEERTGLSFASERRDEWAGEEVGVMHACGHDVHMAVALGAAHVLSRPDVREALSGSVLFVFQPAEEGLPGGGLHGAARMLAEGVFDAALPEAVFGLHVDPKITVGNVGLTEGGVMASVDRFRVELVGRQSHGAYPQESVDPIVIASQLVVALQTIAARNVDPQDAVVVTVGKIEAGNRFNIIPERATLLGTIRTHDEGVQALVHERLRTLAEQHALAFGAQAEVMIDTITPVTYNAPELVRRMRPALEGLLGAEHVSVERPSMGGEDFAFFARETPGLYLFLGTRRSTEEQAAMIHTPHFNPDEDALAVGVRSAVRLLTAFSAGDGGGR